ncbi:MAG: hypothetical protein ACX94A_09200 [Algiphilus sp.]
MNKPSPTHTALLCPRFLLSLPVTMTGWRSFRATAAATPESVHFLTY